MLKASNEDWDAVTAKDYNDACHFLKTVLKIEKNTVKLVFATDKEHLKVVFNRPIDLSPIDKTQSREEKTRYLTEEIILTRTALDRHNAEQ